MTAASSVQAISRSGLPIPHTVTTYRPAPDILHDICQNNNWGDPVYSLIASGEEGGTPSEKAFIYKVTIPNFPLQHPNNVFQSMVWKSSLDEARLEAAQVVLTCLRISPEYVAAVVRPTTFDPNAHPSSSHPLYPLSPAAMQGMPLTAAWPGFPHYPPTSAAHYPRLAYDPNMAAYSAMLQSMYGLSIAC